MAKGEVCKTFIRRFESGRHLLFAEVAELADARDLKSLGDYLRAGSSPAFGTQVKSWQSITYENQAKHKAPVDTAGALLYLYLFFIEVTG